MTIKKAINLSCLSAILALVCTSCGKEFKASDYTAYFGGEVTNPSSRYVLLYKNDDIVDTLMLDNNNRFFKKFDSLAPGMYNFRHEPEYQYVYFDKNDSLMVAINALDFDESIVFSGRGDQKNNYLMEVYLANEHDRDNMFRVFDYDVAKFNKLIDSTYLHNLRKYSEKKTEMQWSAGFDVFARAAIDFPYYSKKEVYPLVHKMRTGEDIVAKLPKTYYEYRKKIDYNNLQLSNYSPYVKYLTHMLSNVASTNNDNHHLSEPELSLTTNTRKLDIADTLIHNEKIKNTILNNIAFTYLLEDQNMVNNQKFLATYHKYSTDKSQKNEITKIGKAIQLLHTGNQLPEVELIDTSGTNINSSQVVTQKAVVFFWSEKALTHLVETHKKVLELKRHFPNYEFIAINLDDNQAKWKSLLAQYKFDGIKEYRAANFEDLKAKWAITKIHRTIVVDNGGKIKNAFTSLFDSEFDENLK
ncbi:MAG: hypothetical protein EOO48_00110 [Flavobacterium sp.]|nr:MAG: hypothetical protein EOO48_00110 [Flavobacterium sp.]